MENTMINVVIADDEERVCRLILALGEWDRLNVRVAGVAQNGIEALELVQSTSAEILITDIRMPGCSGLELIERVRKISPNLKIIIISGYANFEYAQQALKNGVNDYLLKPINRRMLNEAVERLAGMIQNERRTRMAQEDAAGQSEALQRYRSSMIADMLAINPPRYGRAELEEKYRFNCAAGQLLILALKLDIVPSADDSEILKIVSENAEHQLEKTLQRACIDAVCMPQATLLYAVCCCEKDDIPALRSELRELLNLFVARSDLYGDVCFSMALGSGFDDSRDLPEALALARRLADERLIDGTGRLLEKDVSKQVLMEKRLLDVYCKQVNHAIDESDAGGVALAISRLRQDVGACRDAHGWEIMELVSEAGNLLITRLEFSDKKQLRDHFYRRCDACHTVQALFDVLSETARTCMEHVYENERENVTRPVRQACDYIRQHYGEQISLEEVSAHVGLTPAYLSALFKKETEEGFAHYLMGVRIDAARELLRSTNDSVADICRQVGYNDIRHFTRIFEKAVGVKPGTYRKLYG